MAGLLLTCGYIALFLYLVKRLPFFHAPELDRRWIGLLFLAKVAAGTALWGVYTYHYTDRSTADIFKYFDDGNVMFSALHGHPQDYLRMLTGIGNDSPHFNKLYYAAMNNWHRRFDTGYYNDAHTMIRYSAVVRLFSFGVYHVHTVFSAFLALVGLTALYKAFIGFVPGLGRALAAGIFLWPSALFWASAPIKEALLFFGLGLFLLAVFRWMKGSFRATDAALLLLGLLVQLSLKSYILACLLPGLAALWWCRRTNGLGAAWKFLVVAGAALAVVLVLPLFSPGLDVAGLIHQKQRDMMGVAASVDAGSYLPPAPMAPGPMGLLRQVPQALYYTFLSPFGMGHQGIFGVLVMLENLLLLALVPLAFLWARPWAQVDVPLLLFCLFFCLALALLVGWTTPIVGALVRYRIPFLPFWSLAFLLVADPQKITRLTGRART
jgi:hypothetical protein